MTLQDYLDWQEMSKELKELKEKEAKLRRELCEEIFTNIEGKGNTYKFEAGNLQITAKMTMTKNIDEAVLNSIFEELSEEEASSIKYKPSLIAAKFNKLPENCLLMEAITEKPGMPTLEIKEV